MIVAEVGLREGSVLAFRLVPYGDIRARPDQAAEWFGEKLRVDAATVKQVSTENPLIASPHYYQLGVTPDLRAITARWMAEAHKWGLIKSPVDAGRLFQP